MCGRAATGIATGGRGAPWGGPRGCALSDCARRAGPGSWAPAGALPRARRTAPSDCYPPGPARRPGSVAWWVQRGVQRGVASGCNRGLCCGSEQALYGCGGGRRGVAPPCCTCGARSAGLGCSPPRPAGRHRSQGGRPRSSRLLRGVGVGRLLLAAIPGPAPARRLPVCRQDVAAPRPRPCHGPDTTAPVPQGARARRRPPCRAVRPRRPGHSRSGRQAGTPTAAAGRPRWRARRGWCPAAPRPARRRTDSGNGPPNSTARAAR